MFSTDDESHSSGLQDQQAKERSDVTATSATDAPKVNVWEARKKEIEAKQRVVPSSGPGKLLLASYIVGFNGCKSDSKFLLYIYIYINNIYVQLLLSISSELKLISINWSWFFLHRQFFKSGVLCRLLRWYMRILATCNFQAPQILLPWQLRMPSAPPVLFYVIFHLYLILELRCLW